jgi:hypothetical protein
MGTEEADPAAGEGPDHDDSTPEGIGVDVRASLHTAGHEVEDLGFEGVPDSGPVLHEHEEDPVDFVHHAEADIATRGQGGS